MEVHWSLNNVQQNVWSGTMQDDITELHQQGIEDDDDTEPAPKNAQPQLPIEVSNLDWWAASNMIDNGGMWRYHPWNVVAEMTELQLFRLAFPEQYIKSQDNSS